MVASSSFSLSFRWPLASVLLGLLNKHSGCLFHFKAPGDSKRFVSGVYNLPSHPSSHQFRDKSF